MMTKLRKQLQTQRVGGISRNVQSEETMKVQQIRLNNRQIKENMKVVALAAILLEEK